ncbi:MAG: amidohydrolase family protein [Planctomycetes bacterium]|nr:amidohydrolase family protein [Planctomycetota bacterium]
MKVKVRDWLLLAAAALWPAASFSQEGQKSPAGDIRELKLRDWKPRPMLKTRTTQVEKPAFPAIDVHNHIGRSRDVAGIVMEMDRSGVRAVVNLDGGWGDYLKEQLKKFDEAYPGRFLTYALIDFEGIDEEGWSERAAKQLEEDFTAGAKGLKIPKSLGLGVRYRKTGKLMPVDDPKLDPLWTLCGKRKRPVEIHTADPAAFFTPLDQNNERWHELNEHPNWLFYGKDFPSREELLAQLIRVIERHPETAFIGAHYGNNVEDLETVGRWLDQYPNFHIDIDARISELGRQPYSARRFFLKYQDRILFGTDTYPRPGMYQAYYRFLETDDEYWDCQASHHFQGFWMIYGIHLPREVLEKVYTKNAEKILAFKP